MDKSREAFEKWFAGGDTNEKFNQYFGEYMKIEVERAWRVWQAAIEWSKKNG
jgi:hypothetical protein